jgi:alpha-D-xyloside xylohydrolase
MSRCTRRVLLSTLTPYLFAGAFAPGASFPVQSLESDASGVTFRSAQGAMRIDVCSDRIIHVVAGATPEVPGAIVPIAIRPCTGSQFSVNQAGPAIAIQTKALEVRVERSTGSVRFLSSDGKTILSEPPDGGRALFPTLIQGTPAFRVEQKFLSPLDEALYGQHQEGVFNLRNIPLRLQQANTNISVPFLLSIKGYGLLWNNSSLTDFNPADQTIALDPATGKGAFRTGAAGE